MFVFGKKNIKNVSLVNSEKVLLTPLHIKFGLMKQFVKALDKEGECLNTIVLYKVSATYI